jgi:hypothetical protein
VLGTDAGACSRRTPAGVLAAAGTSAPRPRWASHGPAQGHSGYVDRAEAGEILSGPEKLEGAERTS